MRYMTLSFTHKNTDIKLREKLSFSDNEKKLSFLSNLISYENINEAVLLSTCNRVEVILSVKECIKSFKLILKNLSLISGIDKDELEKRVDIYKDNGAIHHLFSVASSLDSLVVGETQISGQLKDAFAFAYEGGFCGQKLSRALHAAFRCAAVVRSQTNISKSPISVSSVAVSKAREIFKNIGGMTAIVVGAGEMSELAAKYLIANNTNVIILNRDMQRAYELVNRLGSLAKADSISLLKDYINRYPLIFSATSSQSPIITQDMIEKKDFKRYFFDIAVPRDIDIKSNDNVKVFTVDDLDEIVKRNLALREEQAKIAFAIVGKATMDFFKWLQALSIDPIIKQIRFSAKEIAEAEVKRSIKKKFIKAESEEETLRVIHQVFKKFLHKPTKNLKNVANRPEADTIVQAIGYFFDISDEEKYMNSYKCEYQMEKDL